MSGKSLWALLRQMPAAIWWTVLVVLVLALLVGCVLFFPKHLVGQRLVAPDHRKLAAQDWLKAEELRLKTEAERLKAENDVRATLVQCVLGLLVLVGGIVAWLQLRVSRAGLRISDEKLTRDLEVSSEELRLTREGQLSEHFTRAIDQLGNVNEDVRLGGIAALEHLLHTPEARLYQVAIVEILTAHVRTQSPWPTTKVPSAMNLPPLRVRSPAVQAAMTALGRRPVPIEATVEIPMEVKFSGVTVTTTFRNFTLELGGVDLRSARLFEANLIGANLAGSNLATADCFGAHFQHANLNAAILRETKFDKAELTATILTQAKLEGADFSDAIDLERAFLLGAVVDERTQWPKDFQWRRAVYGV
jgi:Pentapeptide repeats (8 copies)